MTILLCLSIGMLVGLSFNWIERRFRWGKSFTLSLACAVCSWRCALGYIEPPQYAILGVLAVVMAAFTIFNVVILASVLRRKAEQIASAAK